MSRCLVLAWVLALGGCTLPPAGNPSQLPAMRPWAPARVSWRELSRTPTSASLLARVARPSALRFALVVSVRLPEGVALASGRTSFSLPPNSEGTTHEEPLLLTFEQTPEGDLELLADGETRDVGLHARSAYRFGRPEPQLEVVAPVGPGLRFGDLNLGPSVPIRPQ